MSSSRARGVVCHASGMSDAPPDGTAEPGSQRRPPTAAEARALGHPTRLRILFACREQALTNKELAERLGTTPGTIHYHLRPLVEQSFLRAEPSRPGPRGSREQPYRATGKSWAISGSPDTTVALRQVAADELLAAVDGDVVALTRLGVTLPTEQRDELVRRLQELVEEFHARSLDDRAAAAELGADPVTVLLAVLRQRAEP
jgi:predicted ArsR family transcriptional regulator